MQFANLAADLQNGAATLAIDHERAASVGITSAGIGATIHDAIAQRRTSQYFTRVNNCHVVLEISLQVEAVRSYSPGCI